MAKSKKDDDLILHECDKLDDFFSDSSQFDKDVLSEYHMYHQFCEDYRFDQMKEDFKVEHEELNAFKFEARMSMQDSFKSVLGYMIYGFAGFIAFLYSDSIAGIIQDRLAFLSEPWNTISYLILISVIFMLIVFIIVSISNRVERKMNTYEKARKMSRFIFQQESGIEGEPSSPTKRKQQPFIYNEDEKRISLPQN